MGLSGDRTYRTRAVTFVLLQGCVRAEEFRNTNTYALNFFLGGGGGLVGRNSYHADGLVHQSRTLILSRVCECSLAWVFLEL